MMSKKIVGRRVPISKESKMNTAATTPTTSLKMPQALAMSLCLLVSISLPINFVQAHKDAKPQTSSVFSDQDTRIALASNEAATDALLKSIIGGPILNSEFVAELDGAETSSQYGERDLPQLDQAGAQELAALQEQLEAQSAGSQMENLDGSSAKSPPVYKSAPKQIVDVGHVVDAGPGGANTVAAGPGPGPSEGLSAEPRASALDRSERDSGADLHREAAKQYKKKSIVHKKKKKSMKKKSKKSKKVKKSKKKKVKKMKKVKKVKKMKKKPSVVREQKKAPAPKPHTSLYSGPGHISAPHGDYYQYQSVPAKGAWDFGYKRGNPEHTVQRKEHGDKSHFKTELKWQDKEGEGHHLWDYNHYNKKQHGHDGHHAVAASKPDAASAKKPAKQHQHQEPMPFAKEASEVAEGANQVVVQQNQQQ